jgi:hypothetical protein
MTEEQFKLILDRLEQILAMMDSQPEQENQDTD